MDRAGVAVLDVLGGMGRQRSEPGPRFARNAALTATYNLVHNPDCHDADITDLREIHPEIRPRVEARLRQARRVARSCPGRPGGALVHVLRGRDEEGAVVLQEAVRVASEGG
jgi:hypothetical protein